MKRAKKGQDFAMREVSLLILIIAIILLGLFFLNRIKGAII